MSVTPHASLARVPDRPAPATIALTAKQKRLIRESFLRLEPAFDLVGQLFFRKLYRSRSVLPRPVCQPDREPEP